MNYCKRKIINWNLFWIISFPVGLFLIVRYEHRYGAGYTLLNFCSILMLFIPIIVFQSKFLGIKGGKRWQKSLNILVFIITIFPVLFGLMKLEKYYYDTQLKNHGMLANAAVIAFEETHSKSGVHHFATFKYKFEKRIYTQKTSNENSYYKLGDSLRLIVSNNDPEIFSIIEVKKSTLY